MPVELGITWYDLILTSVSGLLRCDLELRPYSGNASSSKARLLKKKPKLFCIENEARLETKSTMA